MNIEPEFILALIDSMPSSMKSWVPKEELRKSTEDYIRTQIIEIDRASEACIARPYNGLRAEDYLTRRATLSDGTDVLLSISFERETLERFVHVAAFNKPLHCELFDELSATALRLFSKFDPDRVSVFRFESERDIQCREFTVSKSYRMLAAPLKFMNSQPRLLNENRVRLLNLNSLEFYSWYLELYDEFYQRCPDLKAHVPLESEDSFQSCIDQGTCYLIEIEGQRAGVVSAKRMSWLGLSGYMIAEIVLEKSFQGKGFSPAVQRQLARVLPNKGAEALIGTIHFENLPSLKMALRSGRQDLGGRFWLRQRYQGMAGGDK